MTEQEKELEHYKKLFGVGEHNPVLNAYKVYVNQLRQRVEYLNLFSLKSKISAPAKDDPEYARAMDLIDSLPKMITSVNDLQVQLKVTYNPDEEKPKQRATSPQSIGAE
jgi:hypothetical protein